MRRFRLRGPRLATKLLLVCAVLLVIPWLGYQYLLEMQRFLIEGQAQAHLLTAKGVATLLHGSDELFNDLPESIEDYRQLSSYPLDYPLRIDGYADDWRDLDRMQQSFGEDSAPASPGPTREKFRLALGTRDRQLYAFVHINDVTPVYRHPGYRRLDNGDHLRLSFVDSEGVLQRLLLSIEGPGNASAYYVGADWLYASRGQPEYRVQALVQRTATGYAIEMRLPLAMLATRKQLGFAVADVADASTREVASLTGTFRQLDADQLSLVVLRSPAVENLLRGLENTYSRIWVLDKAQRVRATAGQLSRSFEPDHSSYIDSDTPLWRVVWLSLVELVFNQLIEPSAAAFHDFDPVLTQQRDDSIIKAALAGNAGTQYRASLDGRAQIVSATYPIKNGDQIIGAVLLEQSAASVLAMQRQALEKVVSTTLASFLVIFIALLVFAARLTWRIRRLRAETDSAIDPHGRLLVSRVQHELHAADEIGDLARGVSTMLTKLHQYQQFIARMPHTLRHEINNPLNTISTSLENLDGEIDPEQCQRYIAGAKRGLHQISSIIHHLAESASLEEALGNETRERIDVRRLVEQYFTNFTRTRSDIALQVELPKHSVWIEAADFRIEQMLDKLMENAIDFCDQSRPIQVCLRVEHKYCILEITNSGPLISAELMPLLFDSLISSRSATGSPGSPAQPADSHFGLGLYVVRLITEFHQGRVGAENLADGSGVKFSVRLPLLLFV